MRTLHDSGLSNRNLTCAERAEAEALHWRDKLDEAVVELASARDERVVAGIEHRIATAARRVREAKRAAALYRQRADVGDVIERIVSVEEMHSLPCGEC